MEAPKFSDFSSLPIYMAYQPVLKVRREKLVVHAYESLLRVRANSTGMNTISLIHAAESNGSMAQLDAKVVAMICDDFQDKAGINLWINLSQVTLSDPDMVAKIATKLLENNNSCNITVEMTETADGNSEKIIESLNLLKSQQIAVVIDDIDDGFSKSELLSTALISGCKLSRNSTIRMTQNLAYRKKIKSLVSECKMLGKTVVVEGIETREQLSRAVAMGADFCQGFYFWKPTVLDQLPAQGVAFNNESIARLKTPYSDVRARSGDLVV